MSSAPSRLLVTRAYKSLGDAFLMGTDEIMSPPLRATVIFWAGRFLEDDNAMGNKGRFLMGEDEIILPPLQSAVIFWAGRFLEDDNAMGSGGAALSKPFAAVVASSRFFVTWASGSIESADVTGDDNSVPSKPFAAVVAYSRFLITWASGSIESAESSWGGKRVFDFSSTSSSGAEHLASLNDLYFRCESHYLNRVLDSR